MLKPPYKPWQRNLESNPDKKAQENCPHDNSLYKIESKNISSVEAKSNLQKHDLATMQDAADANSTTIARGLLRESIARLGGAALNYVLEDSYKGQYSQFDEYLKLETDNHDMLSDYYVVILHREEADVFMTDLAVFLQDILFHDSPEVAKLLICYKDR